MKSVKISLRLPKDVYDRLIDYRLTYGFSMSKLINIVLESFVYENK